MGQIKVKHKTMKRPDGSDLIQTFEENVYFEKWYKTGLYEVVSTEPVQARQIATAKIEPIKKTTKKSCCGNK